MHLPLFDNQQDDQTQDQGFRLGWVMAGAVSAGAYTAGVMDFMMEALQKWSLQKRAGAADIPQHQVQLHALAGASAGGMCAGILTSSLRQLHYGPTSLKPDPDSKSIFYQAWVGRVSLDNLLRCDDLKDGKTYKAPVSFFNITSTPEIPSIKDYGLTVPAGTQANWPDWVHDPLPVFVTVTNLHGVPYNLNFTGGGTDLQLNMHRHADYMLYALSAQGKCYQNATPLDYCQGNQAGSWSDFGNALLATGAFPLAFPPHKLPRTTDFYDQIQFPYAEMNGNIYYKEIKPDWPQDLTPNQYALWTVDGGAMNNEPFDLAHQAIVDKTGRNRREADKATRMMILIDPFPGKEEPASMYEQDVSLFGAVKKLFAAMQQQSRFKMEELILFQEQQISSRFMIAPKAGRQKNPLASSSLGSFGGFLEIDWRHHDYLLGRMNAQKFLMDWLVVSADHPLMIGKNPQLNAEGKARIIPLVDGMDRLSAAVDLPEGQYQLPKPIKWHPQQVTDLVAKIMKRLSYLGTAQIKSQQGKQKKSAGGILNWITKQLVYLYLGIGIFFLKRQMRKSMEQGIVNQLRSRDLLSSE